MNSLSAVLESALLHPCIEIICTYRGKLGSDCLDLTEKSSIFIIHSPGLASLHGSSLCRGAVFRTSTWSREKATVGIFWTYYEYPHRDKHKTLPALRASPREAFVTSMGLRCGFLTWLCSRQTIPFFRRSPTSLQSLFIPVW